MTHTKKNVSRKVLGFFKKKLFHEEKCEQPENENEQKYVINTQN